MLRAMNRSLWQSNPYRAGIAILLLAMGLCGIYGAPAIAKLPGQVQ